MALVAALIVGACGGDDAGGDADSSSESPTAAAADPSATGTSPPDGANTAPQSDDAAPQSGGTLTAVIPLEPPGLDPIIQTALTSFNGPLLTPIFDVLMVENAATGAVDMRLAESITSDDGVTWTLVLHPDIEFSDGTPFDAEAVQFNWERLGTASRSMQAPLVERITSMEALDAVTLEITLAEVNAVFPRTIAESSLNWIGSPTAIERLGDDAFNEAPVGAGPYMVDRWVRGSELRLVRNPNYYGETFLDELVIRVIADDDQMMNTLDAGGADLVRTSNPNSAQRAASAGHVVVSQPPNGGAALIFNTNAPPFDDVRARRAVSLAFDPRAMVDALYGGADVAADNMFQPFSPFHDQALAQPELDREIVQDLLDELAADGTPLNFSILTGSLGSFGRVAEWFVGTLDGYENVTVTQIDLVDSAQVQQHVNDGAFDLIIFVFIAIDPDSWYDVFHSEGTRFTGYVNPDVDEAMERGRTTLDEDERREAYRVLNEAVLEDVPTSFFQTWDLFWISDGSVGGIEPDAMFGPSAAILWDKVWKIE